MPLREYQQRAIEALRQSYAHGHRAPCLVAPTGAGKTVLAAEIIRLMLERGRRVLFNAHRAELIEQTARKLADAGITNIRTIQAARDLGGTQAPVTVASVQTLTRWSSERMPEAGAVLFDECFPSGTLVDGRPIETLRVGDLVRSFNHETNRIELREVKRLFCSRPTALVTVHLSNGRRITCTAGHPFYDGVDYTPAINLSPGDAVYGAQENHAPVRGMRNRVSGSHGYPNADLFGEVQVGATRSTSEESHNALRGMREARDFLGQAALSGRARSSVLLDRLQLGVQGAREFHDHGRNQQAVCVGSHEDSQSDALCGCATQSEHDAQVHWTSSDGARWQRSRSCPHGDAAAQCASAGMDAADARAHGQAGQRLSNGLQDRHRECRDENCDRGRRRQPQNTQGSGCRREETGVSRVAWVDRVEVHEPSGGERFGSLCPDDLVYNIEVDGNHNYFVAGVLVHNCHHVVAKTWKRIADAYRSAHLLGLTATPQRADGSPLGDVFDDLVVAASVRELTELGHLVPCRVWAPPGILDAGELAMSPVDAYQQHGQDQRAIAFCVTVEHATAVAAEFHARGITSTVLHGGLGKTMRAQILAWFREGQIRVLCNVHVLTEGFDDPGCAVAILCRKPEHAGTYLQMVGRILRPAPNKPTATLIDLCGSSLIHGTPEMERTFRLDGKAISSPEREAIRQCPACGGVFLAAGADACPQCGALLPRREVKPPRSVNVGLVEGGNTDQLRINLLAAAKRSRRSREWVDRAHAAIMRRSA